MIVLGELQGSHCVRVKHTHWKCQMMTHYSNKMACTVVLALLIHIGTPDPKKLTSCQDSWGIVCCTLCRPERGHEAERPFLKSKDYGVEAYGGLTTSASPGSWIISAEAKLGCSKCRRFLFFAALFSEVSAFSLGEDSRAVCCWASSTTCTKPSIVSWGSGVASLSKQ